METRGVEFRVRRRQQTLRTAIIIIVIVVGVAAACALAFVVLRSRRLPPDPPVGALFASPNEDGTYSVFKVLAVDAVGIHIRIYGNRFPSLPTSLNEAELELKSMHESEHPGIGHLPLSRKAYWRMQQIFLRQSKVAKEELEGYDMFKDSGGGAWQ